jgi:hypothetical protein
VTVEGCNSSIIGSDLMWTRDAGGLKYGRFTAV